jgi:hypothetical protein
MKVIYMQINYCCLIDFYLNVQKQNAKNCESKGNGFLKKFLYVKNNPVDEHK